MQETIINGVSCYGTPTVYSNYELTFDNEWCDGIVTDIVASGWKTVMAQLKKAGWLDRGLVQVIAV